jgi:hypothetical protein
MPVRHDGRHQPPRPCSGLIGFASSLPGKRVCYLHLTSPTVSLAVKSGFIVPAELRDNRNNWALAICTKIFRLFFSF